MFVRLTCPTSYHRSYATATDPSCELPHIQFPSPSPCPISKIPKLISIHITMLLIPKHHFTSHQTQIILHTFAWIDEVKVLRVRLTWRSLIIEMISFPLKKELPKQTLEMTSAETSLRSSSSTLISHPIFPPLSTISSHFLNICIAESTIEPIIPFTNHNTEFMFEKIKHFTHRQYWRWMDFNF